MQPALNNDTPLPVLLVDDDTDALEELVDIVEIEGWEAIPATGVEEALTLLSEHPEIGVVVTDVHIVETSGAISSGLDLVDRAQTRFNDRDMSFVVLSGDPTAVGSSIQKGAIDFLTKPLISEDLVSAISEGARSRGKTRSQEEMTDFLIRKVTQKTAMLQKVSSDLETREIQISASRRKLEERKRNAATIRHALRNDFVRPWFQPQLDLHTGKVSGFEALARWLEPDGTRKNPGEFLGMAESSGTLMELDAVIRTTAMRTLAHFVRSGVSGSAIGINFTAMQLGSPDLVDQLLREAAQAGLEPSQLGVEVLETAMVDEVSSGAIVANLKQLSEIGVSIELDDFGTGHAAISSLREFAVDRVKIDRSYVRDVHKDPELQKFTRTLIQLAKTMNIEVLAEGVECDEEIEWLRSEGCDAVQGFHIARPMPSEEALAWAQSRINVPLNKAAS